MSNSFSFMICSTFILSSLKYQTFPMVYWQVRLAQQSHVDSIIIIIGISLWECIVVNLLAKEEPTQVLLLQFYSLLSLPSHFVHLFLLSITITSLLDRYVCNTERKHLISFLLLLTCQNAISIHGKWIVLVN